MKADEHDDAAAASKAINPAPLVNFMVVLDLFFALLSLLMSSLRKSAWGFFVFGGLFVACGLGVQFV